MVDLVSQEHICVRSDQEEQWEQNEEGPNRTEKNLKEKWKAMS
jgi:hypothetical protein